MFTLTSLGSVRPEREYLFIDGGCLRNAVKAICKDLFGDENAYTPHLPTIASTDGFAKVFYYDAVPGQAHGETATAYEARVHADYQRFDQIQALDRVHVALGKIVGKDKRQKGVDVRLAVDMMTFAFRGTISRATLFAGDADFVPLLKALVAEGLHVTLWHPPQANAELRGAADIAKPFNFRDHHQCFTADGRRSAFQQRGSGSGGGINPDRDGATARATEGERRWAGLYRDGMLQVWVSPVASESWSYTIFQAPGATLERALAAYDLVYGSKLSALGTDWVISD